MAENKGGRPAKGFYVLASMGMQLAANTIGGVFIGYYLDRYFGTSPWLTIIFLILGTAAGLRNIYAAAKKYGR